MGKITKVLIANRGEIACRIIRTLEAVNITSVAVYHALDADAPHVAAAGEAVEIIGDTPVGAYLDSTQILRIAWETGADAIHPGYGFLSENAEFAEAVEKAGLTFIGPKAETIRLMGDKIASREFVEQNGYPIAPSVILGDDKDAFKQAAKKIGFPLLLKASAGGGGKGMQIVKSAKELDGKIALAASEADRAFGDGTLYAEKLIEQPRHIEVQVLGDGKGGVIHLGERECSIQRRFQKVIEEAPAPGLAADVRRRIHETAVGIAKAAKYRGAGTVEFILGADGEFYFLEMNTRLQVEHPVTEEITGLDLVAEQTVLAETGKLAHKQKDIAFGGHAIEARLYAEDADNGFLPATGQLLVFKAPEGDGLRFDGGVEEGMEVSSAFDPMLAKLTAFGDDRAQAIERLRAALEQTVCLGVATNIDFLSRVVAHPAFQDGGYDTGFIAVHADDLKPEPIGEDDLEILLALARLSGKGPIAPPPAAPEPYASIGDWRN